MRWILRCYGLSQIAKYTPGNVFHLAGRQTLGMAANIPATTLIRSTVWELGLIAFTAVTWTPLTGSILLPAQPAGLFFGVYGILAFISGLAIRRVLGPHVLLAYVFYSLFLFLSGTIFFFVLREVATAAHLDSSFFLIVCSSYIIAWLTGLLTPGAPAGIGIREVVLLFFLKNYISEDELFFSVLVGRAVTTVGDIIAFTAASFIKENTHAEGSL
jgi:hypothetical protein